jgi:uncharacterized membrane protein YfcA
MWQVYLPIAEVHVNLVHLLGIGVVSGVLAGTFGVGGTFFSIPALTIIGVPTTVAISSAASQMVASSASMGLFYWKNNMVDTKLAMMTFCGSLVGSLYGARLFAYLSERGLTNTAMAVVYIVFLGSIASFMLREGLTAVIAKRKNLVVKKSDTIILLLRKLPLQIKLPQSNAEVSAIMLVALGLVSSMVVALAGLGGGFVIIPTFIYLARVPTTIALGTSNIIGGGNVLIAALMQSILSKSVDLVLASLMAASSLLGIKIGSSIYKIIPPEELRLMLACIMFCLIIKFLFQIFMTPASLFSFNFVVA